VETDGIVGRRDARFRIASAVDRFEAARHFVASFPPDELLVMSASRERR